MTFRLRGPVTRENSIFNYEAGTVACPISTNKFTDDEYFTIDIRKFSRVEGQHWHVKPQQKNGDTVFRLRTWLSIADSPVTGQVDIPRNRTGVYLHQLVFHDEVPDAMVVDHELHWTDNRRASVDFVTNAENVRRGAALFHHGKRNRRTKIRVA